jgi:putative acetyltransferase
MLAESDAYSASLYPAESNHLLDVSSLAAENVSFFVPVTVRPLVDSAH